MAVTQISRIQVRRGRKISPTGIPQLAGGEIAWAVDSQELFIGNGSVAEGAPYVGNTKILTEHDNILALISSYKFGGGDSDSPIPFSVARSFQSKLDEYVSVLDFGGAGDGVSNNVTAFETAFSQLYQNTIETYRKVLVIPNGEYIFDTDLRVPSYVEMVGETKHGVILRFTNNSGIKFVNEIGGVENPADFTEIIRPENIRIANLSISSGNSTLTGSRFVLFENVAFVGSYVLANPVIFPQEQTSGIFWRNDVTGVETTNLKFKSCSFKNYPIGVRCEQSVVTETAVLFDDCEFDSLDTGVLVLGVKDQINNWKFVECHFSNTANNSVYISNGTGTILRECTFVKCGVRLDGTPVVPSVYFGQSQNNLLIECTTDRQQQSGITTSELESYVPEVFGADRVTFLTRNKAFIEPVESFTPIAIFSAFNKYLEIDYFLRLDTGDVRVGKMKATILKDQDIVDLSDEYTYSSPPGIAVGFQFNTLLDIRALNFGRLYLGAVVSGENISAGTRIASFSSESVNPTTGIGTYGVDRQPISSPTSEGPDYQIINFVRDTMTNIQFQARLVDNADSADAETILLEYRQTSATRGSSGTISFDVSYGTSSV
jgi:hypothetical protein